MRARLLLTGIALGATVLVGGAATAQAAPASSETGTSALVLGGLAAPAPVVSNTTAAAPITTFNIIRVGWYSSYAACESDGENSAYSYWYCSWSSSRQAWALYVDDDS